MTAQRKDSVFGRNTRKGFKGKRIMRRKMAQFTCFLQTVDIHYPVIKVTDLNKEDFNITDS